MMINHIMCTLKILTDLCFTKQKIKAKNGFVEVFDSNITVVCNMSQFERLRQSFLISLINLM